MRLNILFFLIIFSCQSPTLLAQESQRIDSITYHNENIFIHLSSPSKIQITAERFIWNKWLAMPVSCDTSLVASVHQFAIKAHSGLNKIRLSGKTDSGTFSNEKEFTAQPPQQPLFSKENYDIIFAKETEYAVYDQYGQLVLEGKGTKFSIAALKRGGYYLDAGGTVGEFFKR